MKITLKQFKQGATLPPPIYQIKPYVILSRENVVLAAGDMEHIKSLGSYYDDHTVEIREHDMESNDNTKISYPESKATQRPWSFAPAGSNMREKYNQSFAIARWPEHNLIAGLFDDVQGGTETAKANAALIVRAINEYDALCAVADAAKEFKQWLDSKGNNPTIWPEPPTLWKFKQALAALESIRK